MRARERFPCDFVLCGVERFPFVPETFNEPVSDGRVHLAGAKQDACKIEIDVSLECDSLQSGSLHCDHTGVV